MCLCGMFAAEYSTLSALMQQSVAHFFERNEEWLCAVLTQGQREQTLTFAASSREKAHLIISCLEGAMLVARLNGDLDMSQTPATDLLTGLLSTPVGQIADTAG
jgi:TetR/AcrR family transcriptional regulator, transcriptional repressor for nem operon